VGDRRDSEQRDFAAEGLLQGLEGRQREARLRLLERLHEAGFTLEQLKEAVAQDRLVLLPAEHALGEQSHYTGRQISEKAGAPLEFLQAVFRAAGLAEPDPDERAYGEGDLEAARIMADFYRSGLDHEGMFEVARVLGRGLAQTADAMGELFGQTFIRAGVTEEELGLRNAEAAREMLPRVTPLTEYLLRRHVRERLRHQAVSQAMLEAGQLPGARDIAVAFIDMVSFTPLGEKMAAEEVGHLAGRLGELASECAAPPVRLVKTIGDAAMLASPEPEPLLRALFELLAAARGEDPFPQLRAGVAYGPAVGRSGDWYGRTVNVASRITDVAEPDTVYATRELCEVAAESWRGISAGNHKLKGVDGQVELFRLQRAGQAEDNA
jgi:adenylate cyclase